MFDFTFREPTWSYYIYMSQWFKYIEEYVTHFPRDKQLTISICPNHMNVQYNMTFYIREHTQSLSYPHIQTI